MAATRSSTPLKDYLKVFGPALIITVLGFVVAFQFVDPAPPDVVRLATGNPEGAYHRFAQQYGQILARDKITLELVTSAGSVENLQLLQNPDSGIDAAIVQGGTESSADCEGLVSLGSFFLEPLWVFYRADAPVTQLPALQGNRIAIGEEGSGTRTVVLQLLADNGFESSSDKLLPLGGMAAAEALVDGQIETACFVASPNASVIRDLLQTEGIRLMSFERADAYTRTHRYLSSVVLPEGIIDFESNLPAHDIVLVAPVATIAVTEEFHPALVDLLLLAATEVHGSGGMFAGPGEFPSPNRTVLPLSPEATRFYQTGPPFLRRYLPFWAATLVERLKVMMVPLLAMLFPLLKIMPPTYRWRVRSRIYRWYKELEAIDRSARQAPTRGAIDSGLADLDRLEDEVAKVPIPLSYRDALYDLRLHIDLVRTELSNKRAQETKESPPPAN